MAQPPKEREYYTGILPRELLPEISRYSLYNSVQIEVTPYIENGKHYVLLNITIFTDSGKFTFGLISLRKPSQDPSGFYKTSPLEQYLKYIQGEKLDNPQYYLIVNEQRGLKYPEDSLMNYEDGKFIIYKDNSMTGKPADELFVINEDQSKILIYKLSKFIADQKAGKFANF